MARHQEELPLLGGVAALLGASAVEVGGGAGACRVFSGEGLVAKVGPPDVVAREAAVLATPSPCSMAIPGPAGTGPSPPWWPRRSLHRLDGG